jgi:hypothetical protein
MKLRAAGATLVSAGERQAEIRHGRAAFPADEGWRHESADVPTKYRALVASRTSSMRYILPELNRREGEQVRVALFMSTAVICGTVGAGEAGHPCAVVSDAADRLACYDNAFGSPAEGVAVPEAPAYEGRDFGFSEAEKRARDTADGPDGLPPHIQAVVLNVSKQGYGQEALRVTLDNGQIWAQAESVTHARIRKGDTITIRKASLGSFLLVTASDATMRVRRLR